MKLLILGHNAYNHVSEDFRIDAFLWDKIPQECNIRDYDHIILSLLDIESKTLPEWDKFNKLINIETFYDFMYSKGEIIILGDPRVEIKGDIFDLSFLAWTGIKFNWDSASGDTVKFNNHYEYSRYKEYFSKLNKWEYSLDSATLHSKAWEGITPYKVSINRAYICSNRYHNGLGIQFAYSLKDKNGISDDFGKIIFLPVISLSEDETIELVLSDVYDISFETSEPEWVDEVKAFGQNDIDLDIKAISDEITSKAELLEIKRGELARCRKYIKLIYEKEFPLEPIVRDVIKELGAIVREPVEKNKEDGWLTVESNGETYEGVMEIKSTRKDTFDEGGRKQLVDWVDRGRIIESKDYKGIFIGNSAIEKPLSERPSPYSSSWLKATELSRFCVIESSHLYLIYILYKHGLIEISEFWKEVFNTNGAFDMKDYKEKLNAAEGLRDKYGLTDWDILREKGTS